MTLLDAWMPHYDVSARYAVRIGAAPERVYAALLGTDFSRPWLVRGLMGVRLFPSLLFSPRTAWRRLRRPRRAGRLSLSDLEHSGFVLLQAAPVSELVMGITGRFWKLAPEVVPTPPERFRDLLPAGLAQGAWNFEVRVADGGSELTTETRIRCADPATLRTFRRYWRLVGPGSGLIRHAILGQVRHEAEAGVG